MSLRASSDGNGGRGCRIQEEGPGLFSMTTCRFVLPAPVVGCCILLQNAETPSLCVLGSFISSGFSPSSVSKSSYPAVSEVTRSTQLKFPWTPCPLEDFLSVADWFVSSPARELRKGSSRSVVAPMDLLVSPPSIPGHVDQRSGSVTCAVVELSLIHI